MDPSYSNFVLHGTENLHKLLYVHRLWCEALSETQHLYRKLDSRQAVTHNAPFHIILHKSLAEGLPQSQPWPLWVPVWTATSLRLGGLESIEQNLGRNILIRNTVHMKGIMMMKNTHKTCSLFTLYYWDGLQQVMLLVKLNACRMQSALRSETLHPERLGFLFCFFLWLQFCIWVRNLEHRGVELPSVDITAVLPRRSRKRGDSCVPVCWFVCRLGAVPALWPTLCPKSPLQSEGPNGWGRPFFKDPQNVFWPLKIKWHLRTEQIDLCAYTQWRRRIHKYHGVKRILFILSCKNPYDVASWLNGHEADIKRASGPFACARAYVCVGV